jgi:hypothetical protein
MASVIAMLILGICAAAAVSQASRAGDPGMFAHISARAEMASRSGLEYARVLASKGTCSASSTATIAGFEDFTIATTCAVVTVTEGAASVSAFDVQATACRASSCPPAVMPAGYAQRTAKTRFWK